MRSYGLAHRPALAADLNTVRQRTFPGALKALQRILKRKIFHMGTSVRFMRGIVVISPRLLVAIFVGGPIAYLHEHNDRNYEASGTRTKLFQ